MLAANVVFLGRIHTFTVKSFFVIQEGVEGLNQLILLHFLLTRRLLVVQVVHIIENNSKSSLRHHHWLLLLVLWRFSQLGWNVNSNLERLEVAQEVIQAPCLDYLI